MFAALVTLASVAISLALTLIAVFSLYLNTYAWWSPDTRRRTRYGTAAHRSHLTFSLIVPCRHESEEVMEATARALLAQSHGAPQIIISVGHDDPDTTGAARRIAARYPHHVQVSVDRHSTKSKPVQLNTSLELCTGDVVGIFDAESIAAPHLLRHIDTTFASTGADAVQGAVQLVNYQDSWYALRNCLEYFTWFRSRLHIQARRGFIPLGGTTVFVRRELLTQLGGWDPDCLAEDCDLGVRLSTLGHKVVVAYAPELVTREETPDSIPGLVRQRTRWALGFMQVYAKGDWRVIPTRRARLLARWTLTQHHSMALAGGFLPVNLALALWGGLPLWATMLAFVPLAPTVASVVFDVCMLREFSRDHAFPLRVRDYVLLVLLTPLYQSLLLWAALRACLKYWRTDFAWEKTSHAGSHLRLTGAVGQSPVAEAASPVSAHALAAALPSTVGTGERG